MDDGNMLGGSMVRNTAAAMTKYAAPVDVVYQVSMASFHIYTTIERIFLCVLQMIVIPVERIVSWRRVHGHMHPHPAESPEKEIRTKYIPSVKGGKTKKRAPTAIIIDESLGIKSSDVAALDHQKNVRVALNKLSPENIDEVRDELNALKIEGLETLRSLGKLFVSKVLSETVFWENYITILDHLNWSVDEWTLRDCFLVELQTLFEKIDDIDKTDGVNLIRL